MNKEAEKLDLNKTFTVMTPALEAVAVAVSPSLYEDLDKNFDHFKRHILISTYSFDNDWPTWEIHPEGDEIVCLLSGQTELVLKEADGERSISLDAAGTYVIVPRGTWHTARTKDTYQLLFITPGEGTENRESPPS